MKENTFNRVEKTCHHTTIYLFRLLAVAGILLVCGCSAKKKLIARRADTAAARPADARLVKLDAIRNAQTSFNTFSGKARTQLDFDGTTNDVTLNIRIKSGREIWISVTAFAGIEGARALITPDSIMVINRLQGVYLKKPFSYVYQYAGDHVNYYTLESLLIGNAIPDLVNDDANLQFAGSGTTLSGTLSGLVYKMMLGPDLKVDQTNLEDKVGGQTLQAVNSGFVQSDNKMIPSQIDISSIAKDKKLLVNLHYVKTDFGQPLDFPFSIPSRYKEVE